MRNITQRGFEDELIGLSIDLNFSIDGSSGFSDLLYAEYEESQKHSHTDPVEWLRTRLKDAFQSVDSPPRWIEKEPAWAYFEGRPMVFISQTELKKSKITETLLTYDETVYLFGIRIPEPGGFQVEYSTISQFKGF